MDNIKIPDSVKLVMKDLKNKGFSAWLTGPGLRELMAEREPLSWRIVTEAGGRSFPEELLQEKRMADDVPVRIQCIAGTIEEYLEGQWFTADGFAYDGKELLGFEEGWEDAYSEMIRTVEPVGELFEREGAIALLGTLQYASETGFQLETPLQDALKEWRNSLAGLDKQALTKGFEQVMQSPYAGTGMKLIRDCGLLPFFVGKRICKTMSKNEKKALDLFIENINGTQPVLERRLLAFYMGFFKNRDREAIAFLDYSQSFRDREAYVHKHLADFLYLEKKKDMKRFIYEQGFEKYQLLDIVSKLQSRLYKLDRKAILTRHNLLLEIKAENEAVFLEDLAVKAEDLLAEGIAPSAEKAAELLEMLVYHVHKHPKCNTKGLLLDQARKFEKQKWQSWGMKVRKLQHS